MPVLLIDVDLHRLWPALLAAIPIGLLVIASINAWLSARNERRRTQPVVICHEHRSRTFSSQRSDGAWMADVYLTNEGGGTAFNVSFGIRMTGARLPWRDDRLEGRPARYRVLRAAENPTHQDLIPLLMPSIEVWALAARHARRKRRRWRRADGTIDDGRVYWCRYENAHGKTWETCNPADPTADLRIRRVYLRGARERVEAWRERRLRTAGIASDAQAREELARAAGDALANADRPTAASGDPPHPK